MKRISVCIVISLVMCLTMAFPTSAAVITKPELADVIDLGISKILSSSLYTDNVPSNYSYRAVFYFEKDDTRSLRIFFFKNTLVTTANDGVFVFTYNYALDTVVTSPSSNTYSATLSWSVNQTYAEYVFIHVLNSSGSAVLGAYSKYYVVDRSTAKFINQDTLEPTKNWQITVNPDTTALQSLVTTAKAKQSTFYTASSWQALQTAITSADNLLKTTGYTQTQVDSAKTTLQTALDGLELLPDTTELVTLVREADTIDDIGYTAPTWMRFDTARTSAHVLLARTAYTQPEVAATSTELRVSMNSLVLATTEPPVKPPPTDSYLPTDFNSFFGSGSAETYLNIVDGFSLEHLSPALSGIEDNLGESRKFGIFVFAAIMSVLIGTRILRSSVGVERIDATGSGEKVFNLGMTDEKRAAFSSTPDSARKDKIMRGSEYRGTRLRNSDKKSKYD